MFYSSNNIWKILYILYFTINMNLQAYFLIEYKIQKSLKSLILSF